MERSWRVSIRSKLTLWYTISLSLILIVFSAFIFLFLEKSLFDSLDKQLLDDFELAVEIIDFDSDGEISLRANKQFDDSVYRHEKRWLEVWDRRSGKLIYPEVSHLGELGGSCLGGRELPYSFTNEDRVRLRVFCTHLSLGVEHTAIRVGRSEEFIHYELNELLFLIFTFLPFGILASAGGGAFLSRRALLPISIMTSQAEEISADNLSVRIPVENPSDELGKLAIVFNKTFERLQRSFEQMKRFTSDSSHELRTPLTAMRAVGEVGIRTKHTVGECKAVISSMLEEAEDMSRLVESLLTLARMESNQVSIRKSPTKVGELIEGVISPVRLEANGRHIVIDLELGDTSELSIESDEMLLRQALRNIVQNAVKFSAEDGVVEICCRRNGSDVFFEIRDSGIGIADEDSKRIWDRFYRADKSRTRSMGGFGLGLPLTRWIVEAHEGSVSVNSQIGAGSTFIVRIPIG